MLQPAPTNLFGTEPTAVVARATEVAHALAPVIKAQNLSATISNKRYVLVEGWTLLGSMLGVFPLVVWTRRTEGPHSSEDGWEACVEAHTLSGAIVGRAEAQCTREEKAWRDRDDYALRAMAQTRATSRALRGPLGFVVKLAGYSTTAAEEMMGTDE